MGKKYREFLLGLLMICLALVGCSGSGEDDDVQEGFVKIQAGSFVMGSPEDEPGHDYDGKEETQHQVTLTHSFEMKVTEVTQAEWKAVMGENPSDFKACGENCPVDNVNWYQAAVYMNALSKKNGLECCYKDEGGNDYTLGDDGKYGAPPLWPKGYDCKGYRLPTEAEWEYAARAGTTSAFYTGPVVALDPESCIVDANLDAAGWYCGNSDGGPHPVGQKLANAWGLYDILGNIAEWTWDRSGDYPDSAVTDPTGSEDGGGRIARGGNWASEGVRARSAARNAPMADEGNNETDDQYMGLRSARTLSGGGGGDADSDSDTDTEVDCGSFADGDTDISGYLALDGFFGALAELQAHVDTLKSGFDSDLNELGAVWGLEGFPDMEVQAKTAELKGAIMAEISATVDGEIAVDYRAPACSSAVGEAMQAMFDCEQQAGCAVYAECLEEDVQFTCEGRCRGECQGECQGYCVEGGFEGSCPGECAGSCVTTSAAYCGGRCAGECTGTCIGESSGTTCDGICDGDCVGECELNRPFECGETCVGECYSQEACDGACDGSCNSYCVGDCLGDVTAGEMCLEGICDAYDDCLPQSQCWARALVSCSDPALDIYYTFSISADESTRAAFDTKMAAFSERMLSVIRGSYELRDIIEGFEDYGTTSGLVRFDDALQTLRSNFDSGDYDSFIGARGQCVEPAMEDSMIMLDEMLTGSITTLQAEMELIDILDL
jgi:formylglycine-generating enzyme required for sulfatase activity